MHIKTLINSLCIQAQRLFSVVASQAVDKKALIKSFYIKAHRWFCPLDEQEVERVKNYVLDDEFAIELETISLKTKDATVIDNFSYQFKKNNIYGIIGSSGSGKTALTNYFNGINKCDTGNVYLFTGEKICFFQTKIPNYRKIRKTVGMALQFPEYQLFRETVIDDVAYGLKMCLVPEKERIVKATATLLDLGVPKHLFDASPFSLSGGQKRKVALSAILAIDTDILVFDEPSIGLDPYSKNKIVSLIKVLKQKGKTIIIISNNMDLIYELSDEILVLEKGRLLDYGKPMYIFRNPYLNVGKPKIVSFIEKLTNTNQKFDVLWDQTPRNVSDLSDCIANVIHQ